MPRTLEHGTLDRVRLDCFRLCILPLGQTVCIVNRIPSIVVLFCGLVWRSEGFARDNIVPKRFFEDS